jgi:hypothetical protein
VNTLKVKYLSPSFLFSTSLPPCSPLLTTSLPSSSPSYSLPLSLLHLNPPPHYFSSLIPLHPLPHYLSPSFLSVILTISLPPSSSSLLIRRARREISREEEGGREVVRMTERKEGDR